jgi:hypothetical protein
MPAASALRAEKVIAERSRGAHPCVEQEGNYANFENFKGMRSVVLAPPIAQAARVAWARIWARGGPGVS